MSELLIVVGVLILLAGLIFLASPRSIYGVLQNLKDRREIQVIAVVMRLLIGTLLVSASSYSKYPQVVEVLGWVSIAAAIVLAAMGRKRFRSLIGWVLNSLQRYGRMFGLLAIALGGFLVHAFA